MGGKTMGFVAGRLGKEPARFVHERMFERGAIGVQRGRFDL
jgi:hypothetical protein